MSTGLISTKEILPYYLASRVFSATLARLDDHVGELLHFGGSSRVVEYRERFQILRDTARGGRCLRVQSVVQAQQLLESTQEWYLQFKVHLCLENIVNIGRHTSTFSQCPTTKLKHPSYRAVCRVWAPQVGTGPRAVVGIVTARFVDPLPVQVTSEINVEPANTAALLRVPVTKNKEICKRMYFSNDVAAYNLS